MARYAIGLGSNLGDRLGHLIDACRSIEERLGLVDVSSMYETEPIGGPEQDPFLNAVAVVETELKPEQVLEVLQGIETDQGRERTVHWGPRTLDLDIVAGPPSATERLAIPHPRAAEREFVLRPLADVWPDALVGDGLVASAALASVGKQGVDHLASDWRPPVSRARANSFVVIQMVLLALTAVAIVAGGGWPPANGFLAVVGGLLALCGLGLALWASRALGTALTPSPLPRPESDLVTAGPYGFARHPIYGGLVLLAIGSALVTNSLVALAPALLLVLLFLAKSHYEEGHLRMRHPGYRSYMETVPRRLIPFIL